MEPVPFLWRRLQASYRLVALTLPLFLLNALVLALSFQAKLPASSVWTWVAVVFSTGLVWEGLAWLVRAPTRPRRLWLLSALLVAGALAMGLECSWFLTMVPPVLSEEGRVSLALAVALLASTGVLILAAFPLASAAWAAGLLAGVFTILGNVSGWEPSAGWLLALSLVGVLAALVTTFNRQFLSRLKAESRASAQTQLVGLLLHDFGQGSEDWVWETDKAGKLMSVSPRLGRELTRAPRELEGKPLLEVLIEDPSRLTIEDEEDLETLSGYLKAAQPFHDLEIPVQIGGHYRRWRISARPVVDDFGVTTGWLGVGTDITEVQRIHNLNARLALLDNLTGLANRHRLQAVLHDALSPRAGDKPFGLILIDLQNFRMVNEGLGHETGDQLLKDVALRLRSRVPTSALLARLGGDEFALLAPGAGDAALEGLVAALESTTDEPFVIDGHRLEVIFQMGVAAAPQDARGAAELLKCAELALHEAKRSPHGTTVIYRPELGTRAHDKIRLHNELKTALLEGQFELHFQPQIRASDGSLAGSEALVRWRHPGRGLVSPAEFIPALEETGLIVPVGVWILEAACREAMTWPETETVAVNVSAIQFASKTFLESVEGVLAATGFPPGRLELEITESVMAQDPRQVFQALHELRSRGIHISLDDFGTGYSSLSYLRQLPLDKLKVDQSFVRVLDQDPAAAAIIQTVLDLSRNLGLKTTAEGVETEAQRDHLKAMGVDNFQGYFYSRPLSATALNEFRGRAETPPLGTSR